jgi:hypothetical protein
MQPSALKRPAILLLTFLGLVFSGLSISVLFSPGNTRAADAETVNLQVTIPEAAYQENAETKAASTVATEPEPAPSGDTSPAMAASPGSSPPDPSLSPPAGLTEAPVPAEAIAALDLSPSFELPYSAGPAGFPAGVDPLTGLPVPDPGLLERRPLAIKIPNFPRYVRPQSGLSRADLVYEYYLEQGITRFVALFFGQEAEKAGPVRSGRYFDEHIFRMYQAFFVFSGADERVLDYFMSLEPAIVNRLVLEHPEDRKQNCRPGVATRLCRDRAIASYNNLFANTAALSLALGENRDNTRPDLSGMRFEALPPGGGEPGTVVDFNYSFFSYSRWAFDAASGRYLRFQDNQDQTPRQGRAYAPLLDSLTGQTIATENVVTLFVPHDYYLKSSDTEIMKIDLFGLGQAMLFRDGRAYPAMWVRPAEGLLYLLSPAGEPLPFKPGVTFFQVIGVSSGMNRESGAWEFSFGIP